GRNLVADFVGADVVRDEISAQATAASHSNPNVDTVIELGGQDSKYISMTDGRVIDFEMNKVCAAGTGAFLQEQAARLNEKIEDLAQRAFAGKRPVDLGSRCTVFMESELINFQQQGIPKEDLIAGLSHSIVVNYLEKVVATKPIGERVLLLGGVAFNDSVRAAFERVLEREIEVPEHHEASGALGMAILARDYHKQYTGQSAFRGFNIRAEKQQTSAFQCIGCEQSCRIQRGVVDNKTYHYGGGCDRYETRKVDTDVADLFKEREQLILSYIRPASGERPRIGVPRAQFFHEIFPLCCVFLQELGFDVVVSQATTKEIVRTGLQKSAIDNCFSSKIAYGHVDKLRNAGIHKIFFPSIVEFERRAKDKERNYACPYVQAAASLTRLVFPDVEVIEPVLVRERGEDDWKREFRRVGRELGGNDASIDAAIRAAGNAQTDFRRRCESLGSQALANAPKGQQIAVVMGKLYNVNDAALNLNVGRRLRRRGVLAIPYDCLPLSEQTLPDNYVDMVWSSGQDLIRAARVIVEDARLHPILVTNFGCGPDSFSIKYLGKLFEDRSLLVLEVDEHTSGVGMDTRIEAYLNNLQKGEGKDFSEVSKVFRPFVSSPKVRKLDRLLYVPVGFDSYRPIAAAFEAVGIRTKLLPEHDETTQSLGRKYTNGSECLPYIMHVGDAVRMTQDTEFSPDRAALFLPASDLACRISLFPTSVQLVLAELGYPDVPIVAPRFSMDKDEATRIFGIKSIPNVFRGMLAIEMMSRLRTQLRAYEIERGSTDAAYQQGIDEICESLSTGNFYDAVNAAVERLDGVDLDLSVKRPVIGLVGDDYTRGNPFANNRVVETVEAMGGQVRDVPIWSSYFEFQLGMKPYKAFWRHKYGEFLADSVKSIIGHRDMRRVASIFEGKLSGLPDPSYAEMMRFARKHLNEKAEPLTLIALAHARHLLDGGVDGIINVLGFQCMVHAVVAPQIEAWCHERHTPSLKLTFDFMEGGHKQNRIEAFMYQVMQRFERKQIKASA
ncbi:MAG: hypothetical protein JXM70_19120, partial [Pirellulales bacterium]|nr:hypothetical protein [Pirellulales bacterium]